MADLDQVSIWRGALCEQQHAADVDQVPIWRGAIYEQ